MQLAMAGDGHDLYVAGEGTLSDFHLGSEGQLSHGECYDLRSACSSTRVSQEGFGTAAVTPNGGAVLSVFEGEKIDVYRRNSGGSLTFSSCLSASGDECRTVAGSAQRSLFKPQSIAIAPNGRDVYVTGSGRASGIGERAIAHLRLTEADTLEFVGCSGEIEGCEALPAKAAPFEFGEGKADTRMAVTPNGKLLLNSEGTSVFAINSSSGALSCEGCAGGAPFCAPTEGGGIGPQGGSLLLTPAGTSAWLSAAGSGQAERMNLDTSLASEGKPAPQPGATEVSDVGLETADVAASAKTYGLPSTLFFEVEAAGGHLTYAANGTYANGNEVEQIQDDSFLLPGTSYRVRLVAITAAGASDGPWASIKIKPCGPLGEVPGNYSSPSIFVAATSISVLGAANAGCNATTLKLQYGTTPSYGGVVELPSSRLPVDYRPTPYFLEAAHLKSNTTYYLRLTATNKQGTTVLEENWRTTPSVEPPAVQVAVSTAPLTPRAKPPQKSKEP